MYLRLISNGSHYGVREYVRASTYQGVSHHSPEFYPENGGFLFVCTPITASRPKPPISTNNTGQAEFLVLSELRCFYMPGENKNGAFINVPG